MLFIHLSDMYYPQKQQEPRKHESLRNEVPLPGTGCTTNTSCRTEDNVAEAIMLSRLHTSWLTHQAADGPRKHGTR